MKHKLLALSVAAFSFLVLSGCKEQDPANGIVVVKSFYAGQGTGEMDLYQLRIKTDAHGQTEEVSVPPLEYQGCSVGDHYTYGGGCS